MYWHFTSFGILWFFCCEISISRIFLPHQVFLHPWKLTHPCTVSLSIMPWCWFPVSQNRIWMFQVMLWQWQIVFNRPKLFRITAWGTKRQQNPIYSIFHHLFSRNHWLISIIEEFHDWVVLMYSIFKVFYWVQWDMGFRLPL